MKITAGQLRTLIKEEYKRRLDELYPGSNLGSYLKQGVTKLWEADNMFQRALSEAEDDGQHKSINAVHQAIEKLAFAADDRMQRIIAGESSKPNKPKSVPQAPERKKKVEGNY